MRPRPTVRVAQVLVPAQAQVREVAVEAAVEVEVAAVVVVAAAEAIDFNVHKQKRCFIILKYRFSIYITYYKIVPPPNT